MVYSDSKFYIVGKAQFAERLEKGFNGGKYSTDGEWVIGTKGDQDDCDWIDFDIDLIPQYMKDLGVIGYCITNELAAAVVAFKSSGYGESDGYCYYEGSE